MEGIRSPVITEGNESNGDGFPVREGGAVYSQVEIGPRIGVTMEREVKARQEIREMISSKPGVVQALMEKRHAETARSDRFYGPQLPVAWAASPPRRWGENGGKKVAGRGQTGQGQRPYNDEERGESEDSDEESVADMLAEVHKISRSGKEQQLQQQQQQQQEEEKKKEDPHTYAYLTSSLAVPRPALGGVIMRPPPAPKREEREESSKFDFIGPQLPIDWGKKSEKGKAMVGPLDMRSAMGRDDMKVIKKGQSMLIPFNAPLSSLPKSSLGPGEYDVLGEKRIGGNVKGVAFHKVIARDDQVGPRGM